MFVCIASWCIHVRETHVQTCTARKVPRDCENVRAGGLARNLGGFHIPLADRNQKIAGFDAAVSAGGRVQIDHIHGIYQSIVFVQHLCTPPSS
jgi:hypothetical protein